MTAPTPCQPGEFATDGDCQPCESGTYLGTLSDSVVEECIPCPAGTYQNQRGQRSCKICNIYEDDANRGFCSGPGNTAPTDGTGLLVSAVDINNCSTMDIIGEQWTISRIGSKLIFYIILHISKH